MTKPVLGLALGGALGIFDGLSALVSAPGDPNVKAGIVGIVIGIDGQGHPDRRDHRMVRETHELAARRHRVRPGGRPHARLLRVADAEDGGSAAVLLADHAARRSCSE